MVQIAIDKQGNPRPPTQHVKSKDQVYWKADDPTQTWYIRFVSPFFDDVIVTDPDNNGETEPKKVRKAPYTYPYMVSPSNDPQQNNTRSAGGIIVDAR